MSWAKIDDRANENHKLLDAGAEACWLWACGLMYANRQPARDGFIPELALGMLYPFKAPKRLAERLVAAGLWIKDGKGYRIHQYHQWNPTAEQIEAERAAGRERAAKSYENRKPPKNLNSSGTSSPEEPEKNRGSSGVEWSGPGLGSGSGSGSRDQETARELKDKASCWVSDPLRAALEYPNPEKWPETLLLVATLTEVFGGAAQNPRHSSDPRMRTVLERWAEGRTNAELLDAIRGAAEDDQIRAKPQLQTLTTILRDSGQVDRYARLLTVSPAAPRALPKATTGRASDALDRQMARAAEARQQEAKVLP